MRPIHRWKTFWLGLLILTFLIWAWSGSRTRDSYIAVRPGKQTWYGLANSDGYLFYVANTYPTTPTDRIHYGTGNSPRINPWFPRFATLRRAEDTGINLLYLGIAHWLLTFLAFLAWAVLLLWRARLLRSQEAKNIDPQPSTSTPQS